MSKLFPNYDIDLVNRTVFGHRYKRFLKLGKNKKGYVDCSIKDCYGNVYKQLHEVLIAEKLQLPKHLWPKDKNGLRYEIDHINTNRSDNRLENIRLVSHEANMNNENTKSKTSKTLMGHEVSAEQRLKNSITSKGKHYSPSTEFKKGCKPLNAIPVDQIDEETGEVLYQWPSSSNAEENGGFNRKCIDNCARGEQPQYKDYIWKRHLICNT